MILGFGCHNFTGAGVLNVLKVRFLFGIEIWCSTTIIRDVIIMCMNKKHWLISRICKCLRSERHLPNISSTQSIPGSSTYCHIAINAECTYMQGLRCQSPRARGGKWNLGCGGGNGVPLILLAHHYFPPETRNASVLLRGRVYLLKFRHNLTWTLKSELGTFSWEKRMFFFRHCPNCQFLTKWQSQNFPYCLLESSRIQMTNLRRGRRAKYKME